MALQETKFEMMNERVKHTSARETLAAVSNKLQYLGDWPRILGEFVFHLIAV